ncbi:MAG: hypothetical protein ACI909_003972 [Planctomycetota bacterium]
MHLQGDILVFCFSKQFFSKRFFYSLDLASPKKSPLKET